MLLPYANSAVREESTLLELYCKHKMCQDRDETIRSFGARIRGQADICKYVTKCPGCDANVNYTQQIMRDVVTKGIADQDISDGSIGRQKSKHDA